MSRPALVLAASLALAAPVHATTPATELAPLASGLRVVHAPSSGGGASACLFVRAGTHHDPDGRAGAAEIAAAVVAVGSKERAWRELQIALREQGAHLSAQVAGDYALLRASTSDPARLEATLALVSELVREPRFDPASVDAACASIDAQWRALRGNGRAAAERLAPGLAREGARPDAPDPWTLRTHAFEASRSVHERLWKPDRAVLAISGIGADEARALAERAFASWLGTTPPRDAAPDPGAATATIAVPVTAHPALALSFPGPPADALATHALVTLLAARLGHDAAVAAPLPASGTDVLILETDAPFAREVERARAELAALASGEIPGNALAAWRDRVRASMEAAASEPGSAAFWAGLSTLRGFGSDLSAATDAVDAASVAGIARRLGPGGPGILVAADENEASRIARRLGGRRIDPWGQSDPAAARARAILSGAIAAQGSPERLAAVRAVDERAQGMFHGIGTQVAIRTRTVHLLPDFSYVESAMYNHDRHIINRLVGGEVWVDRSGAQTLREKHFEKARLMARQAHLHPALLAVRLRDHALLRWSGEWKPQDPAEAADVLEAVDELAGNLLIRVRRSDRAITHLDFSLAPLDGSRETHDWSDFRVVDGVRLPFRDIATASGRPWKDSEVTIVSLPDDVPRDLFLTPGSPDPAVFTTPGPPDGRVPLTDVTASPPEPPGEP